MDNFKMDWEFEQATDGNIALIGEIDLSEILTESEMKQRDQENHLAALQKANWKIKGAHGAAELLGLIMKPTTLLTRMKRMRLRRPASVEAQKY
jgi:hypothetical protein